jgi:hypothetical protein
VRVLRRLQPNAGGRPCARLLERGSVPTWYLAATKRAHQLENLRSVYLALTIQVMSSRPSIPADVARRLRRESGYGCAICGCAVYQYHHIIPWAVEAHYRPEDMMLLCPNAHDAATKGALSEHRQRQHKRHPHNVEKGYASGALMINQSFAAIRSGGVLLVGDTAEIAIDGRQLLRLAVDEDGELLFSAAIENQKGEVIAVVDRNEWVAGDSTAWDLSADHHALKIWTASREIGVEIRAKDTPIQVRADLWHAGQLVRLSARGIEFGGSSVETGHISNLGLIGIALNLSSATAVTPAQLMLSPYLGTGAMVSEPDPIERLRRSRNAWYRISRNEDSGLLA